jgi:predicted protein tyrosine phosphatase
MNVVRSSRVGVDRDFAGSMTIRPLELRFPWVERRRVSRIIFSYGSDLLAISPPLEEAWFDGQSTSRGAERPSWRLVSEATRCSRPVAPELPTMSTPKIYVCGVPELEAAFSNAFTHVISIWDPEWVDRGGVEHQLKKRLAGETRLHIAYFHDCSVEEPGRRLPVEDDLRQILAFAADLKPEAHVLIHCWAGISRSTAVAYAILCQFTGPGRESDCIEAILAARPQAFPNSLIVDLADRILERRGAMRQACDKLISRVYLRSAVDDEF